jgi:sugar diacid utilization regulator
LKRTTAEEALVEPGPRRRAAVDDAHPQAVARELEGDRRADHPGADHDGVVGLVHAGHAREPPPAAAPTGVARGAASLLHATVHDGPVLSDLQALAEALAARLDRAVAIDDPRMRLLVHTPHHGQVDPARTRSILERQADDAAVAHVMALGIARTDAPWVRVPGRPDLELLPRVCAPLRAQGALLGYLWIIDADESLSDAELSTVADTAASAALVLHRERLLVDLERGRDRERLRDLLSDDVTVRRAAADALRSLERVAEGAAHRALVVHVLGDTGREDVRQAVEDALDRVSRRLGAKPALHLARGDHGVLLLEDGVPRPAAVQRVREELTRLLPAARTRTGVGDASEALEDVARSWQQARQALRVAEAVPGFGDDVTWSQLGVYRVLVHLPLDELPDEALPPALLHLLTTDGGRELVRTVEGYLDHGGDARSTAEELHVHRTTLYYRLSRFTELTGLDLGDGDDRLTVHLGLKLARLAGRW